jgi:hypothetical protein
MDSSDDEIYCIYYGGVAYLDKNKIVNKSNDKYINGIIETLEKKYRLFVDNNSIVFEEPPNHLKKYSTTMNGKLVNAFDALGLIGAARNSLFLLRR